ncbi:hypothetical protein JWZ98_02660 [Methylomonas sp. EFPC1]|uniref:hypothetical protein n=1 Tax=Methylomonas sp. EFPC1 TaxID=2812647 RepID=UPI001968A4A7|nr:hypothetical protein [Methylomonas sp. EFPC1]QSB01878.1 hypothetical protein JWZ98_02660 [Methylomonas sp. EFPC1]
MTKKLICCFLLILSQTAKAAIGGGDNIDFATLPNEFCNADARQKQHELLSQYPKDEGIIKLYASFIGLCQLVADGNISEHTASMFWAEQRDKLLQERREIKK